MGVSDVEPDVLCSKIAVNRIKHDLGTFSSQWSPGSLTCFSFNYLVKYKDNDMFWKIYIIKPVKR